MTARYRVNENNLSVSHNGKVYGPGDLLPDDLTEEQIENLLENDAIERAGTSAAEAQPDDTGGTSDKSGESTDTGDADKSDTTAKEDDKGAAATKPTATRSSSTAKPTSK